MNNIGHVVISGMITSLLVLAAATLVASPAVCADTDTATPPAPGPDPAFAFPAETLIYVECRHISDGLETLNRMEFWPEMAPLLNELAMAGGDPAAPLSVLSAATDYWNTGAEFRRNMDTLCGVHLAAALVPSDTAGRPEPVVAAMGLGEEDPVKALAWLTGRISRTPLIWTSPRRGDGHFVIRTTSGTVKLAGQLVGRWTVFSTPDSRPEVARVAEALRQESPTTDESLSAVPDYQAAMASLPDDYWVRGYLNSAETRKWFIALQLASGRDFAPVNTLLSRLEQLGMTREVSPERIRSRITGRSIDTEPPDGLTRLHRALHLVGRPMAIGFPADALAAGDIGAAPGEVLDALGWLLQTGAPNMHARLADTLKRFCEDTGLEPDDDLHPYLGHQTAVAVLPALRQMDQWPLQRPLMMVEVFHRPQVESYLTELAEWEAGAVAELSNGMVSAMVVSEEHEGVEIRGLQLAGFLPLPLPSPSFAFVGDRLIVSPVRSAVREAISALHGTIPTLVDRPNSWMDEAVALPGAVEIFSMNFNECEFEWSLAEKFIVPFLPKPDQTESTQETATVDGEPRERHLVRIFRVMARLLAQLGEMNGSTTMDREGHFVLLVENRPPRLLSAAEER